MKTQTLYFNSISTGCSCCRGENFCEGPFKTLDEARESARRHHKEKTLCSQWAPNGCQATYSAECRIIETGGETIILMPFNIYAEGFGAERFSEDAIYGMTPVP